MKIAKKVKSTVGIEFQFDDGHNETVNLEEFSPEMIQTLAIHGLSQKLGDSYASAMSVREARESFDAVYANLRAGMFNAKARNAGGGDLAIALERATGRTAEEVLALLSEMDADKKKELRKKSQIAAILATIKAERESAKAERLAKLAADTPLDFDSL